MRSGAVRVRGRGRAGVRVWEGEGRRRWCGVTRGGMGAGVVGGCAMAGELPGNWPGGGFSDC